MGIGRAILLGLTSTVAGAFGVGGASNPELQNPGTSPPQLSDSPGLECHGDKTLSKTNAAGREISLFVDRPKLAVSVHKTNSCASCHSDLTSIHPDDDIPAKSVSCVNCHEKQSKSYSASVHGLALKAGRAEAAT